MKQIPIIILLLTLSITAKSQFSYQKLVDNGKIDVAFKKVKKRYKANSTDASVIYDYTNLYLYKDCNKAYIYLKKTETFYAKAKDKKLKTLNKKGINNETLKQLRQKVCNCITENTIKHNSIKKYKESIKRHPDCPYLVKKLDSLIYEKELHTACYGNSIKNCKYFLEKHPDTDKRTIIENRIAEIEKTEEAKKQEANKKMYEKYVYAKKTKQELAVLEKNKAILTAKTERYLSKPHDYSNLKAVIITGGDIDINYYRINSIVDFFRDKNIEVHVFDHNAKWEDIVKAAKGANFLLYKGHGIRTFDNDSIIYGGMYLNKVIKAEQIYQLKLAPNAVVLLDGVCYSAGSSDSDVGNIDIDMARERVEKYAKPYIYNGAAIYCAIDFSTFLSWFFKNFTVDDIFYIAKNYTFSGNSIAGIVYLNRIYDDIKDENYTEVGKDHTLRISSIFLTFDYKKTYSRASVYKKGWCIEKMEN